MAQTITPEELKGTIDDLGGAVNAFKKIHEKHEDEIAKLGSATAETKSALDKVTEDMLKSEEKIQKIQAKLDSIPEDTGETDEMKERKKFLLNEYIRKGLAAMNPEHIQEMVDSQTEVRKQLGESVNPTAGFLVRDELTNELIRSVTEFSPMRSIARVMNVGSAAVQIPKRTATFSASWVSETGARAETTGTAVGVERIPVHELHARVDLTNALLEDTFFDIEGYLREEFAEQFAVAEGTAFVTGNGVGRPEGFTINAATLAAATTSGTVNLLNADDFSTLLIAQLKEPYHMNATFVMSRGTLGAAMQLKDGNGQYLWQPGLQAGIPGTILGRPYVLMTDMPAVATGAEALACGDFRRGYMIVDRIGINIRRIEDTTTASAGGVAIYARKRVGGQVINSEAIKLLTIQ